MLFVLCIRVNRNPILYNIFLYEETSKRLKHKGKWFVTGGSRRKDLSVVMARLSCVARVMRWLTVYGNLSTLGKELFIKEASF